MVSCLTEDVERDNLNILEAEPFDFKPNKLNVTLDKSSVYTQNKHNEDFLEGK